MTSTTARPMAPTVRDLLAADPTNVGDRGRLEYIARNRNTPDLVRRIARQRLDSNPAAPRLAPGPRDPFESIFRWDAERRRDLTPSEVAMLAEMARRADELTLDDAVAAVRLGAVATDDAAVRLAEMAARPQRAKVAAEAARHRAASAGAVLAGLPPAAPKIPSADRVELFRLVADELARVGNLDHTEVDVRTGELLDEAETASVDAFTARRRALEADANPTPPVAA